MSEFRYLPAVAPPSLDELVRFLSDEHERISLAMSTVWDVPVLTTEPEKPRQGMIRYADGTAWNPGSGEGLYVYKTAGWTFIV